MRLADDESGLCASVANGCDDEKPHFASGDVSPLHNPIKINYLASPYSTATGFRLNVSTAAAAYTEHSSFDNGYLTYLPQDRVLWRIPIRHYGY